MKNNFFRFFNLGLGLCLLSSNALGGITYSRPGAPVPVPHRPGTPPPPPFIPKIQVKIYAVGPTMVRIDVREPGARISRIMDVLELKNRLAGLHFAPADIDAEVARILTAPIVPASRGPITIATEEVLVKSGREPFRR